MLQYAAQAYSTYTHVLALSSLTLSLFLSLFICLSIGKGQAKQYPILQIEGEVDTIGSNNEAIEKKNTNCALFSQ